MELGCGRTSSEGNAFYLKSDNNEILLIEAGILVSNIKQMINYDIEKVVGCIISHSHS